ncbi:DNA-directed RNA polymerase [Xylariaceae sp. FL0255]|nr:DNA-directed RNA polymerase [Xylariaceae sp. FL0255]
MLTRHRRATATLLTKSQSSLRLLAPTRVTERRRLITRPDQRPWRRRAILPTTTNRSLATAVDTPLPHDNSHLPLYHIRNFDPKDALCIYTVDERPQRAKTNNQGVPGDYEEIISVFEACLDVNKIERAAIVLSRLSDLQMLPPNEMVTLHNRYLRAVIDRALEQPESQWAQSVHDWYEIQIRGRDLPHNTDTIACMLKVSLLSAQGSRLERLVTRYMDMIPHHDIYSLVESGILNQQDFGTITNIYQPASDLALEDWDSMLDDAPLNHLTSTAPSNPTASADHLDLSPAQTGDTPQVMPVPQKGLGLATLRDVLSFFNKFEDQDLSKLSADERREIQAHIEKDCIDSAINRWKREYEALSKMGRNNAWSGNTALNSRLYEWLSGLEKRITEDFDLIKESEARPKKGAQDFERCLYGPFLLQSTPSRLAAVTIMGTLNSAAQLGVDKGIPLTHLLHNLARVVEDDVKLLSRQRQRERHKKRQASQTTPMNKDPDPPAAPWPASIRMKVAAQLLSALLDTSKIQVSREHPQTKEIIRQMQPAFSHTTVIRKGKKTGMLLPNKVLVELMMREPRGDFLARHLPMLVEPRPWASFEDGGFLESGASLIRIKNGEQDQKIYTQTAVERGDMDQVMKGLDVLGRTAWRINTPVFQTMLDVWNSGEEVANFPPLHPQIPLPEEPADSDDPMARRDWLRRIKIVENEKSGLHSERCFMNFQLEIARAYRNHTFYFPHNLDFRGRAYPIPAYLNHMGADHMRGILRFANGKELGEHGLRWLKVQLANVYGFDKASLKERESFTMDHLDDIFDSAMKPLDGKRWWLTAEDPWQCLAACFEVKAALESPDPTKFVSHLPVHQDGTCNGLQHYAALGGDTWGAEQVNLLPSDRPADVYSAVAELVQKSIEEDAANDYPMALPLLGKITRKVVKQTVMTNVYGVTFVGAKTQVMKQLDALYPQLQSEFDIATPILANYIATKIFDALSTMFGGAHDIQTWLGECAGRVCRALTPEQLDRIESGELTGGKLPSKSTRMSNKKSRDWAELLNQMRATIVWTTPLRMPIVQPYRKNGTRTVSTCMQDFVLTIPDRSDPVNRRKQLQAFPPNFIHSLDASHMLLSALACDDQGLTFAAVHDSFWTHAADVDVMNTVLRDAFIRIHSEDVIGRLAAEFKARYQGSFYMLRLPQGSEVEKVVMKHRKENENYDVRTELLEERERLRLLKSSNPDEVEQGRKMRTPAAFYEEMCPDQMLSSTDMGMEGEGEGEDDGDLVEKKGPPRLSPAEALQEAMRTTHFERTVQRKIQHGRERKKSPPAEDGRLGRTMIWVPLTIPKIPKKGDFDVSQLQQSQYFFS